MDIFANKEVMVTGASLAALFAMLPQECGSKRYYDSPYYSGYNGRDNGRYYTNRYRNRYNNVYDYEN